MMAMHHVDPKSNMQRASVEPNCSAASAIAAAGAASRDKTAESRILRVWVVCHVLQLYGTV